MSKRQFVLSPEVVERIPGLRVLLFTLLAVDQNNLELKSSCEVLLKDAWKQCGHLFNGDASKYENVQSHPQLAAWRECFKSLGISIKKHVCSAESLAKRAAKDPANPRSINPLVDFYNAISVKHMVPFGAFDLNDLDDQVMSLRMTHQGDMFEALDGEKGKGEELPSGEAAYMCEPHTVITRHINYRQSKFALVSDNSQNVVMMAEMLPAFDKEMERTLCQDIKEQCEKLFGQQVDIKIISKSNETVEY